MVIDIVNTEQDVIACFKSQGSRAFQRFTSGQHYVIAGQQRLVGCNYSVVAKENVVTSAIQPRSRPVCRCTEPATRIQETGSPFSRRRLTS